MLNYPKVVKKTYEELYEEALHLIPLYSKEWTNFNVSDPAITILENLTAFQALQIEKMDKISEKTDMALLALAGFTPQKESEAELYVTSDDITRAGEAELFKKGSKFTTEDIVFETESDTEYVYGQIISAFSASKGEIRDHTDLLVSYDVSDGIYPFGREPEKGDQFYLVMNAMVKAGSRLLLYLEPAIRDLRRDYGDLIQNIYADISAEIFTGAGYARLDMKDHTGAFLAAGLIELIIPEGAEVTNANGHNGYVIRFNLDNSRYDVAPKINKISAFLMKLVQRDTHAVVTEEQSIAEGFEHHIDYGRYTVNASDDVMRFRRVGFVHGFDGERFELTPFKHIVPSSLEFLVEYRDDFGNREYRFSRDMEEFSFHLEEEDSILVVDIPGEAVGGELLMAGMALYKGAAGNIIVGNRFEKGFYNPIKGSKGRFAEGVAEVVKRFVDDINTHRTLVNEEDYESVLLADRRMLIDKVHAWKVSSNEVHLTVKPASDKQKPRISDLYKEMIYEDIERARLLTTKVVIDNPIYVGIQLMCSIRLKKYRTDSSDISGEIEKKLREKIESSNFGASIRFQDLYSVLHSISQIELIDSFSMIPENYDYIEKQGNDIKAADECLLYPSKVYVKFVR